MKSIFLSIALTVTLVGAARSQIIISEIMQNPEDVVDGDGEWFEVYNTTGSAIDLQGWDILDNGSESHTITASVVVSAGGYTVLCRNSDPIHNGINGGFACDYEYSGINLFNSGDAIILRNASDTEIDRVEYDGGVNWPAPYGASIVFTGTASDDNNNPANWTTATLREPTYGADIINCCDKGSPRTAGSLANLPVELAMFEVLRNNRGLLLRWETAAELHNAGFAVEHRRDGAFRQIAFVEGQGTKSTPTRYEHEVATLDAGDHRFRLKQLDLDGSFSYSHEVEITVLPDQVFELSSGYPNPFNSKVSFQLMARHSQPVTVDVIDVLGRRVSVLFDGDLVQGARQTLTFESDRLPSGTYTVRAVGTSLAQYRNVVLLK